MKKLLQLNGIIRDLSYCTKVHIKELKRVGFDHFDINAAPTSGIIEFKDDTSLGLSWWKTPKPSRTHPSARIYNTYGLPKIATVIPVIKDEGKGTKNNDRINFMTFSRMNLMNVYIVLAWYESAVPKGNSRNKIEGHRFNSKFVGDRILDIKNYRKSALHWNVSHFLRHFEYVFRQAVRSNQEIAGRYDIELNSTENHLAALDRYIVDGKFNLDAFAWHSSRKSSSSAKNEAVTIHEMEYLDNRQKAYFELHNLLGGKYFLTADGVYFEHGRLVIQESKNARRGKLPSLADIQEGLFKNILFNNIDELYMGGDRIEFTTRLKLTGRVAGELGFPIDDETKIDVFANANNLSDRQRLILKLLNDEANANVGVTIQVSSNQ